MYERAKLAQLLAPRPVSRRGLHAPGGDRPPVERGCAGVRPVERACARRPYVRIFTVCLLAPAVLLALTALGLPYRGPAQLVAVWEHVGSRPEVEAVSGPDIEEFRGATHDVFSSFGGFAIPNLWLVDKQGTVEIRACLIEESVFDDLGIRPALGRTVQLNDPALGEDPKAPVWVSAELWRSRYGSNASVIGSAIQLQSTPGGRDALTAQVVGVLPPNASVPLPFLENRTDVWYLLPRDISSRSRQATVFFGLGRLRPGVTAERAGAALTAVALRLGERYGFERARRPVIAGIGGAAQGSTGRAPK